MTRTVYSVGEALLVQARANVAARQREKGREQLAAAIKAGVSGVEWSVRHKLYRLRREVENG